jgi:predicted PurR-regulated permease PerM
MKSKTDNQGISHSASTSEILFKTLIWGSLLLIVYGMRSFFLVIFLTFIVTYTMRTVVTFIERRIFRRHDVPRSAEVIIVISCFLVLLTVLYNIGSYLGPKLVDQGQSLVRKFTKNGSNSSELIEEVLANTVGFYLFKQEYGEVANEKYQKAFSEFRDAESAGVRFQRSLFKIEEAFESSFDTEELNGSILLSTLNPDDEVDFREWVLKKKAPLLYSKKIAEFELGWQKLYKSYEFKIPGITPLSLLSAEERSLGILRYITNEILTDESLKSSLINEWRRSLSTKEIPPKNSPEYERLFKEFYQQYRETSPSTLPYNYEVFDKLRSALKLSNTEFARALDKTYPEIREQDTATDRARWAFEKSERLKLVGEWRKGSIATKLRDRIEEYVIATMTGIGRAIGEFIPRLLTLPVQLFLALLLSFLISIDIPRMKRGIALLADSRARKIYFELAPSIASFGKLIGRAFEAQAVIAIVNSILTFIAIQFLGIQNSAFLCAIVFLCSFIPVLGVVFSSLPIAVMALIQDGGGLMLALSAVGAILIVHFIETSLLNPKIVGDMLHLHPVMVIGILAISEHFFGVWGLLLGVPVIVYLIRCVIMGEDILAEGALSPRRKKT